MEFCAGQSPILLAYKNEGADWVRVSQIAFQSNFTFPATPKFSIAYATGSAFSTQSFVRVINMTAAETQEFRCAGQGGGTRLMSGTAKRVAESDDMFIGMGSRFEFLLPGSTSFSLLGLRPGPMDLVSVLVPADAGRDRLIIVRHDIDVVEAGVIPLLDFTSAEARPFATSTITTQGIGVGAQLTSFVDYRSARGTRVAVASATSTSGAVQIGSVSPSQLGTGDQHRVELVAVEGAAERRHIYHRNAPGDSTIAFAPPLSAITVDTVATSSSLRPRVRVASQPEYASLAHAVFTQTAGSVTRTVVIMTTSGYTDGRPATWELEVPDLTRIADFPSWWSLQAGTPLGLSMRTAEARLATYFGVSTPLDGETVRIAQVSR
jgi:hypothetical protein